MDSITASTPGYKGSYQGTARPTAARTGFTARRGGSKSLARYSRLTKEEATKPSIIVLPSDDSSSDSDSSTEQDVRPPTRTKQVPTSTADKGLLEPHREAVSKEVQCTKSTAKDSGLQKKQAPMARLRSPTPSSDEEAERQAAPKPTPRKVSLATSTTTERSREQSVRKAHSPPENAESEREVMARSIIAGFPRRALETLLLNAALGSTSVMKDVIKWNSKHPVEEEQSVWFQSEHGPITVENDDPNNFRAVKSYSSLPPIRDVRPQMPPKSKPVRPTPSRVPVQESSTDKTIEQLLEAAERRRELGEEYIPPQAPERKRRRAD
jgi:hypothetical protein